MLASFLEKQFQYYLGPESPAFRSIFLFNVHAVIPRNEESTSRQPNQTDPSLTFRMTQKHKKDFTSIGFSLQRPMH